MAQFIPKQKVLHVKSGRLPQEPRDILNGILWIPHTGAQGGGFSGSVDYVLTDADYDSESNHCFARDYLNIKGIISAKYGRSTLEPKPLKGKYRELMHTQFDKKLMANAGRQKPL
jgi:hypothetical protein